MKRISTKNPEEYYNYIRGIITYKLQNQSYDLIVTSDDAAYRFVLEYGDIFPSEIPHLFCGVSNPYAYESESSRTIGGVLEHIDFEENINNIKLIHPQVKRVYYIADLSLSAKNMETVLSEYLQKNDDRIELYRVEFTTMEELLDSVSRYPKDSVILYNSFFYDAKGEYFPYDKGIELIAESSSVPVYGQFEFSLNHGIVGGRLLSGVDQGNAVGDMAVNYLIDSEYELKIVEENSNRYQYDYIQMKRHGIDVERLPEGADITNYTTLDRKNILILHSYDKDFQWTDNIDLGIKEVLDSSGESYNIYTEFMGVKQVDSQLYLHKFWELFREKHNNRAFDLIVTSDDAAFEFANNYLEKGERSIPIIFCGLNYIDENTYENHPNFTGVLEAYDIRGTINIITKLQPEVRKILVINDETVTGMANDKNVKFLEAIYEGQLSFEYTKSNTMAELLTTVAALDEETAILLMTFNKDRANNVYTYSQSIEQIKKAANVPMYGLWDFYLGSGIVGGHLTDGRLQGQKAGELANRVLGGENPGEVDIINSRTNNYAFDMEVIKEFGLNQAWIPTGSKIVNGEKSFGIIYDESKSIFNVMFLIIALMILATIVLYMTLRSSKRKNNRIQELATFDHLTGIFNRGSGIDALESFLQESKNEGKGVTICFMDLNRLKEVNDHYGHKEGDDLIASIVGVIGDCIGKNDIFCRMGGDEFMVVLTDISREAGEAFKRSVNIRLKDASETSTKSYDYSLSMGLNHFIVSTRVDISEVIEKADTLMYHDKAVYRKNRRK